MTKAVKVSRISEPLVIIFVCPSFCACPPQLQYFVNQITDRIIMKLATDMVCGTLYQHAFLILNFLPITS
jgi:hypothetical protein